MKCSDDHLFTPLYLKLDDDMPWPEQEHVFYLMTHDGLFLCRRHPLFQSCVRAQQHPSELASQHPFLRLNYPRIPKLLMEQIIGFFDLIGQRHKSEAAVLLVWNQNTRVIEVMVPDQTGIVGSGYGSTYPLELEYEVPPLPPHLLLIGDIHSHVDHAAYASGKDKNDEQHRPGLHLVVGRLYLEPPDLHCEIVADGTRFKVKDPSTILEGYVERRPSDVPQAWIDKVSILSWSQWTQHKNPSTQPSFSWQPANTHNIETVEVVTGTEVPFGATENVGFDMQPLDTPNPPAKTTPPKRPTSGKRTSRPPAS